MEKVGISAHQVAMLQLLDEFDRVCKILALPYILYSGSLLGAVRHQGFIPWDDDLDVMMLRPHYRRFLAEAPALLDPEIFFLQGEFSDHWPMFFSKLRLQNTACLERYHPKDPAHHQGIYLDIFPCDNALKGRFLQNIQYFASKIVIAKALYRRGYDTRSTAKKVVMQLCRILPARPFWRIATAGRPDSSQVNTFFSCGTAFRRNLFPRSWITEAIPGEFEGKSYPISARWDALLTALYDDYRTEPDEGLKEVKRHAILVDTQKSWTAYEHYRDGMEFSVLSESIR